MPEESEVLEIEVPKFVADIIRKRAKEAGVTPDEYIGKMVLRYLEIVALISERHQ